ncbi:MAG: YraN family protein [Alistipes indistinctus]
MTISDSCCNNRSKDDPHNGLSGASRRAQHRSRGERLAAEYLLKEGFDLLHRNWRNGRCEIDLVARRDGVLHIIEVKSRAADGLTAPEEAMTAAKFRSLCKAARSYIATYGLDMNVQFDFIGVEFDADGTHTLRYLPDAMAPRW